MKTYRYFLYDIQTELKKNYDDSSLSLPHLLYLTVSAINELNFEIIDKRDTGLKLSVFDVNTITDKGHYSEFKLPDLIYNLKNDKGIKYIHGQIIDDEGLHFPLRFHRIDPRMLRVLQMSKSTSPSTESPYFYLIGDTVRLLGVNCTDMLNIEIALYSPIKINLDCTIDGSDFSIDNEMPIDSEKVKILRYRVLDAARFGLQLQGEDINDGRENLRVVEQPIPERRQQNNDQ